MLTHRGTRRRRALAGALSRYAGKLGYLGAVGSYAINNYDYNHGNISGGEYSWNMMGTFGPIMIGLQAGAVPGAAAGVLWTGADLMYRGAEKLYDLINESFSFDFTNSINIMRGFSPNH